MLAPSTMEQIPADGVVEDAVPWKDTTVWLLACIETTKLRRKMKRDKNQKMSSASSHHFHIYRYVHDNWKIYNFL